MGQDGQSGPQAAGLYSPEYEHGACGVGFVTNIDGTPQHVIIERALTVLERLLHRGATGADAKTGDGAGILIQMPDAFLRSACAALKVDLPDAGGYGAGLFFTPADPGSRASCRRIAEEVVLAEDAEFLGWREVPCDGSALGERARRQQPCVLQGFISGRALQGPALERKLYVIRKQIERRVEAELALGDAFCIPSLSCRTLVYKGMMLGPQLARFYADLRDPTLVSAVAVIHQRYSTNTFPSWKLAQPFRYLGHNGEINTLPGNLGQMRSRERSLASDLFGADIGKILPVIDPGGSDSACLDNAVELLVNGGRDLAHAMMMLIPQGWGAKYPMGPDLRGFFEYHAGLMEPWDGPAAVVFTDGNQVGALLDRNGLRPARYLISRGGFMVLASEAGVLDWPDSDVAEKGALRPGQIILVDFAKKRVLQDGEVKSFYARRQPYRRWVEENKIVLHGLFNDVAAVKPDRDTLQFRHRLFGYTREDLSMIVAPMASTAHEPVGSMGHDAPLAVLSEKPQLLYGYFKQRFAQVTNPPIDPIREELVMSLTTFMGNAANILAELPQFSRLIKLRQPILSNEDLDRLRTLNLPDFRAKTMEMGFPARTGGEGLEEALDQLCHRAEAAVAGGVRLIVLSDRNLPAHQTPIPALLAVSAVNRHLSERGSRTSAALIVETGEAREVHHLALLLGYGATAVNPYLAFETVADMAESRQLESDIPVVKAIENIMEALCRGLLKVMSKMGISTLRSYRSAQVFEAVGLDRGLVGKYFAGTPSRVGGVGIDGVAAEANARYEAAYDDAPDAPRLLPEGGYYRYRRDGERHLWTPEAISALQLATRRGDYGLYKEYARLINDQARRPFTLRGRLRFRSAAAVPIEEVEPVEAIVKRFVTSAMSFGSISKETHETLAVAMNRLGAMSNSGEGGEDPERYRPLPNGDSLCSAVKQVASGRFGVTAEYLVNARELQIKIAQGAKPGEGGQLPGHKVNAVIARIRHSTPGVTLISPPPHHDIYSIEDIKQLIFDLKNVNPRARISVKLVSEVGVGTVAAGVAKGKADVVLISGYDGGTGAVPLSSIRHAGVPWELGLSETQHTLVLNGLRQRIRIQADGQMKTGRDVVIAALLGAEEFGFATAPLVVCGCVMMRKCHSNTCPVGVATQDPELRKRFSGRPEHVVNFFRMVAEEVREHMALLGFRRIEDLIGRSDLLEKAESAAFWKLNGLDFGALLDRVDEGGTRPVRCLEPQDHEIDDVLDRELIRRCGPALDEQKRVSLNLSIGNAHRTTGGMLSGEIARRYGGKGLPDGTITCAFRGSAGQSFGAYAAKGLTLILEGEANDYLGKGLCGGRIVVKPPADAAFDPSENIICGNVLLYGATSGQVYINGRAGERFAIRNSGAVAVVEGVGDHGCEYMTGGRVVVLGETGVNFAAGMSGGIAYVYDPFQRFDARCNLDMVDLDLVSDPRDIAELRKLLDNHVRHTGSRKAAGILASWEVSAPAFVKVFPMEYRRILGQMSKDDEATEREAIIDG